MADKILAALASLMLLAVIGVISYQETNTTHITVDVQLRKGEDPFQTLKTIMPHGSTVLDVRELNREKNSYKLVVATRQKRNNFIDWVRRNNQVEKVEVSK